MSINTKITLAAGGSAERAVRVGECNIPDLWHVAETIRKRQSIVNVNATADQILNCWHLAHDFKKHIVSQP